MVEITIDGNNFNNLDGFYSEIDKLLTKNLQWKTGHNFEAFNDLLRGGFGVHESGEPLRIKWINYNKSKENLGKEVILELLEIICDFDNSGHDCKLELYNFNTIQGGNFMKSKKERLENLDEEKFCFDFFDGTHMPNNPKFINITMFVDTLFLENEKEEKENYGDMYFIILVKKLIEENLENIEKMTNCKGELVKSSFNQKFYLKIDSKIYRVNRNVCNEEGQKLFDDFKSKLYKILNINK